MADKTPDPGSSPQYLALLQLLRAADAVWNASRLFFERWDLSPSQFNVLNLLRLHPSGLSQSDLSAELLVHRSNVTGLVDRLEKRALLSRHEVPGDRRAYRVRLTPAGSKLLAQVLPVYYAGAGRVWASLSARRCAALIADLDQVARNATRVAQENSTRP